MKKITFLLLFNTFFCCFQLFAQKMKPMIINGDTVYVQVPSEGDKLYEKGDIKGAIAAYRKQLKKSPADSSFLCYNLACAFTKDGNYGEAFKCLYADMRYDTTPFTLTDPDLFPLRRTEEWNAYYMKLKKGLEMKYSAQVKNFPLAEKLWEMQVRDQAFYYEIDIAEKKMGMNCPVALALWEAKEELNAKNVRELDSIITASGWPKVSEVGHLASGAAFLIIQHSTLELQQKYLPTIKALCEQKEADWQSYALMYDRVQIRQGKPQLYGSQINYDTATGKYVLFPIEDEKNVNKRRAEFGMKPLEEYVKSWGIKYVPAK